MKKRKIILSKHSCNISRNDVAIDYQNYSDDSYYQMFTSIYEGDKLIFLASNSDPDDPRPYILKEIDLKTGRTKEYIVELGGEYDMEPAVIKFEKNIAKSSAFNKKNNN